MLTNKSKKKKENSKKNLLWFYLRCPDILLREVSCNIIKGDAIQKEATSEKQRNKPESRGISGNQLFIFYRC